MGRKPHIILSVATLVALAFAGGPGASAADAGAKPARECFRLSQLQSTRPDGDQRIYARVDGGGVYRLDLESACSTLRVDNGLVLQPTTGGDIICSALDLDISARDLGGGATPCFLKSISKLTPAEIAAIPPRARP